MDLEYLGTLSRVAVGTGCLLFLFYDYSMPPGRTQDAFEAGADRSNAEQKDALRCQGLMYHLPPDPGRDRRTGPRHAHKHPPQSLDPAIITSMFPPYISGSQFQSRR